MKKQIHVLIIDNDPLIRRLFGGKLSTAGFEVIYSSDGNEGREIARRLQPDLILLDIRMPGDDGYIIARRMREEPRTAHIPIVFLTNEDLSIEAEKAMKELWIVDYIHKSVDLNELVKRVKEIVSDDKKRKKEQKEKDESTPKEETGSASEETPASV